MKRHKNEAGPEERITKMATELAGVMTQRSHKNHELLVALANAVATNEKVERKFRYSVLDRLSRIETIVQFIHGAQIATTHGSNPGSDQRSQEHAEAADRLIDEHSQKLGLKMVRYIYGESGDPITPRDRRRKWTEWEI